MTLDQISELSGMGSSDRLDLLESIWLSGDYPDISFHLRQIPAACADLRWSLVELDLEYRWKRYQAGGSLRASDPYGFPLFPKLEDYAELLGEAERSQVLNPQLLAEEYRVRRCWGDHPPREAFLNRISDQLLAIEEALDRIDTELQVEGMTPLEEHSRSLQDSESTILNQVQQAVSDPLTPSPNIGKYELQEFLGRGGFGEVWKAYDPNLKRYVALKFPRPDKEFSPELLENFRREAQKMAALEQVPGIVPVYEAGESNGVPYLVSFYVEGSDLGVRFKKGSLTLEESVRIVAAVAETLHRAHLSNLFHRDVKLSNILISRQGRAFLSDFGLCVSEEEQLHESHSATGTYAYMSPEQIQGNSHQVDGRADIYSLGVVLYRLLTQRLPYVAGNPADYMNQVLSREPRPPRSIDDQIPPKLERICLKCLRKSISERYTTAGDLAEELRVWLNGSMPVATADAPPSEAGETSGNGQRSKQISLAGIFAVSCIITSGFALSYFWNLDDPPITSPVITGTGADAADDVSESDRSVELAGTAEETPEKNVLVLSDVSAVLSHRGAWDVRETENAVLVYSDRRTMKTLDEVKEGEQIEFAIEIEELGPDSKVGIFFGMSDPSLNSQDADWQMLVIDYDRPDHYDIWLETFRMEGISKESEELGRRSLELPRGEFKVGMTISGEGLESLQIDDENLYSLISEYQEKKPGHITGAGRFGLLCLQGNGVFSKPVIRDTPMKFRRRRN